MLICTAKLNYMSNFNIFLLHNKLSTKTKWHRNIEKKKHSRATFGWMVSRHRHRSQAIRSNFVPSGQKFNWHLTNRPRQHILPSVLPVNTTQHNQSSAGLGQKFFHHRWKQSSPSSMPTQLSLLSDFRLHTPISPSSIPSSWEFQEVRRTAPKLNARACLGACKTW